MSILPEHKTQGLSSLIQIGKAGNAIPPQMEKAKQIYLTKTAPSFLSMNPREDQAEAAGAVMRDMYSDYFANQDRYNRDPDLLIKRAIEKTKAQTGLVDTVPNNPYESKAKLLEAYNYYVHGKTGEYEVGPGRASIGRTPKYYWQKWFNQMGETMPPWPTK
jgi:hypothetical protein